MKLKSSLYILAASILSLSIISCRSSGYSSSSAQNKMHRVNKYHGYPRAISSKSRR